MGCFPAVGVAWTVSNERFMKRVSFIDYLKLKGSWGKNGNQSLAPYMTLSQIKLGQQGGIGYPSGMNRRLVGGNAMINSEMPIWVGRQRRHLTMGLTSVYWVVGFIWNLTVISRRRPIRFLIDCYP